MIVVFFNINIIIFIKNIVLTRNILLAFIYVQNIFIFFYFTAARIFILY